MNQFSNQAWKEAKKDECTRGGEEEEGEEEEEKKKKREGYLDDVGRVGKET